MNTYRVKIIKPIICFVFIIKIILLPFNASAYETRINPSPKVDEYIIPHSAEEKLDIKDLSGLDAEIIELAKNEIFARHGLIFQQESMNVYFRKKTWYKEDREFKKDSLNYAEAANVRSLEDIIRDPQKLNNAEMYVTILDISVPAGTFTDLLKAEIKAEGDLTGEQKEVNNNTESTIVPTATIPDISVPTDTFTDLLKAEIKAEGDLTGELKEVNNNTESTIVPTVTIPDISVPTGTFSDLIKTGIEMIKAEGDSTSEPKEVNNTPEPKIAPTYDTRINPSPKEDEFIIPHSAAEKLSKEDLAGLDTNVIELAKNEIYARHGLVFQQELMNVYFGKKTWYKKDSTFKKDSLNYAEAENARLLEKILRDLQKLKDDEMAAKARSLSDDKSAKKTDDLAYKGELIVATARAQIGRPYKYASADPVKGFDCSGLVYWVFQQHGIKTPRSTPDLKKTGISIPLDQLRPGDILIAKNRRRRDSPHGLHAGIYAGNGMVIHAHGRKKYVKEVKMSHWNIDEGRRLI